MINSIRVGGIEEIVSYSITRHLSFLARSIVEFKLIVRLEVRGDRVDVVLSCLSNEHAKGHFVFPTPARLTINSHAGSGESILSYIRARNLVARLNNSLYCKISKVILDGCTQMRLKPRLQPQELLSMSENVGDYSRRIFSVILTAYSLSHNPITYLLLVSDQK